MRKLHSLPNARAPAARSLSVALAALLVLVLMLTGSRVLAQTDGGGDPYAPFVDNSGDIPLDDPAWPAFNEGNVVSGLKFSIIKSDHTTTSDFHVVGIDGDYQLGFATQGQAIKIKLGSLASSIDSGDSSLGASGSTFDILDIGNLFLVSMTGGQPTVTVPSATNSTAQTTNWNGSRGRDWSWATVPSGGSTCYIGYADAVQNKGSPPQALAPFAAKCTYLSYLPTGTDSSGKSVHPEYGDFNFKGIQNSPAQGNSATTYIGMHVLGYNDSDPNKKIVTGWVYLNGYVTSTTSVVPEAPGALLLLAGLLPVLGIVRAAGSAAGRRKTADA